MPFTPSHVAAVLPFLLKKRKWISETGLIVGAVVPDFEYFFRMKMKSEISHSWLGLLVFSLPVGILLCYLFHNSVRDTLIPNLPQLFQKRWMRFTNWSWNKHFNKEWTAIVISLLIGSLTHILWDGFTHYYGMFVQLFNYENVKVASFPLYRVLQHTSTIIGSFFLIYFFFKMPVNLKTLRPISWRYWLAFLLVVLSVFSAKGLMGNGYSLDQYGNIIVALISGGLLALLISPAFIPSPKK